MLVPAGALVDDLRHDALDVLGHEPDVVTGQRCPGPLPLGGPRLPVILVGGVGSRRDPVDGVLGEMLQARLVPPVAQAKSAQDGRERLAQRAHRGLEPGVGGAAGGDRAAHAFHRFWTLLHDPSGPQK